MLISDDPVLYEQHKLDELQRLKKANAKDAYAQALATTHLKGLGMSYPIRNSSTGFFEGTYTTLDNERVKILNLMNTSVGERYMQPAFGLELEQYLFDQSTPELEKKIQTQIESKVEYWLPNVNINSITVEVLNNNKASIDENTIIVTIIFSLKNNSNETDTITFTF